MSGRLFSYKALDSGGKTLTGTMEAANADEVGSWLVDRRYYVLEIAPAPLTAIRRGKRDLSISLREMNYFLVQLSSLINAGCPLLLSLQALHRQLPSSPLKTLLKDLKEKIEVGKSFSDALKGHPTVFSNLFITMVEVGEVGGILDEVMERYSQIHDAMFRIRSKVIKSMIYPAILLGMTILVAWALLVYFFPSFVARLESTGQALPLPTQAVLWVSNFLSANTWFLLSGIILAVAGFILLRRSEKGAKFLSTLALRIPLLGGLVRESEIALFARTLGTLLKCGVPILTSLTAVERALGNAVFKSAIAEIKGGVARGESLSTGMARHRDLFPESLVLMADVGERGGNTGPMLDKAGIFFERDLETTIEAAVSLIQPLLVIFLGVFIVILAFAMYLPIFDIYKWVR